MQHLKAPFICLCLTAILLCLPCSTTFSQNITEVAVIDSAKEWLEKEKEKLQNEAYKIGLEKREINQEIKEVREKLSAMKIANIPREITHKLSTKLEEAELKKNSLSELLASRKSSISSLKLADYTKTSMFKEVARKMDDVPERLLSELSVEEKQELISYFNATKEVKGTDGIGLVEQVTSVVIERKEVIGNKYRKKIVGKLEEASEVINFIENPSLKDRLFVETDMILSKENWNLTNLSPLLGYQFTAKFSLGIGTAIQNTESIFSSKGSYQNILSSRLMARYRLLKGFSLQTESITRLSSSQYIKSSSGDIVSSYLLGSNFTLFDKSELPLSFSVLRNLRPSALNPSYATPWLLKLGVRL